MAHVVTRRLLAQQDVACTYYTRIGFASCRYQWEVSRTMVSWMARCDGEIGRNRLESALEILLCRTNKASGEALSSLTARLWKSSYGSILYGSAVLVCACFVYGSFVYIYKGCVTLNVHFSKRSSSSVELQHGAAPTQYPAAPTRFLQHLFGEASFERQVWMLFHYM